MAANISFPGVTKLFRARRNQGTDFISSLPEQLICHIFSFLPIKYVLRTSVLSKRWRHCWTGIEDICIHFEGDMLDDDFFDPVDDVVTELKSSNLSVNSFRLHSLPVPPDLYEKERLDSIVAFATRLGVKDLSIELYKEDEDVDEDNWDFYELPIDLLKCQAMVNFRTRRCYFSDMNERYRGRWDSLWFFTIDTLELDEVTMAPVWGKCPALEHLELINCFSKEDLGIYSGKLRELVIRGFSTVDPTRSEYLCSIYDMNGDKDENDDENDGDDECQQMEERDNSLEISAPHLESLRLLGKWRCKTLILLKDLSSLIEAHLDFKAPARKKFRNVIRCVLNRLLGDLCLVTKLFIGRYCLQALLTGNLCKGNRQFGCRFLSIKRVADHPGLLGIADILKYTPNVEKLVIDLTPGKEKFVDGPFESNQRDFAKLKCLAESLVRVEIIGIDAAHRYGLKYALLLVRFLLRYSVGLEKMVFRTTKPWAEANPEKVQLLAAKVRGFQRGSHAARVILTSSYFNGRETVIVPQPPMPPPLFRVVPFRLVYERRRGRRRVPEPERVFPPNQPHP